MHTSFFSITTIIIIAVAAVAAAGAQAQRTPAWPLCDPIAPRFCMSPYPNNFFAVIDSTTSTALRVNLTGEQMPQSKDGRNKVDPVVLRYNERDGFGTGGPIMFSFSKKNTIPRIDGERSIPSWKNIPVSMRPSSLTLLIDLGPAGDAAAGSYKPVLFPHWTEQDKRTGDIDALNSATLIYPAEEMPPGHKFAVVVRGMKHAILGTTIEPSPAFASLVDGSAASSGDASLRDRLPEFQTLFSLLESSYGIKGSELQLAWFFTTQGDDSQLGKYRHMLQDAMQKRVPAEGPRFFINKVKPNPSNYSSHWVYADIEVPLYLNECQKPGATFNLAPGSSLPQYNGLCNVSFVFSIPKNFGNGTRMGLTQSQHGLFLDAQIVTLNNTEYQRLGYEDQFLNVGCDWWGLTLADIPLVADMASKNISKIVSVADSLAQALINVQFLTKWWLSLEKNPSTASAANVALLPLLKKFNSQHLNFERKFYQADSLGAIMSIPFMASSTDIKHSVVRVPGEPFGLLLPRSSVFGIIWDILVSRFSAGDGELAYNMMLLMNVFDYTLEVVSGPAFARHLGNPSSMSHYRAGVFKPLLPNVPRKQFIMAGGLSDALVTSIARSVTARTLGCMFWKSNVLEPGAIAYGFKNVVPIGQREVIFTNETNQPNCIFQTFDFGNPPIPVADVPVASKYNTHPCTRMDPRHIAQWREFFRSNGTRVVDFCDPVKGCHKLASSTCK